MSFIYNLGMSCYSRLVSLAACRNKKAKKLKEGQKHVFSFLESRLSPEGGYIWFHAASLGEFEQGRPLIEALKREDKNRKILLTFFSPSGYEVRKDYEGADLVCYLPFDLPENVRRFLDLVRPEMAVFIKYEFWKNYLEELHVRKIPVYLISGIFRRSQLFFKPYGGFYRNMLFHFTRLYVQDEASEQLLLSIGITDVKVCGDTRFDRVTDIRKRARALPLLERFVTDASFTLVAGSTWAPDEDILIPYFNDTEGLKLIIAPHEIHEGHLSEIESKLKRPFLRYSEANEANVGSADCLIIDNFGLLSSLYRYGRFAYVGGGFGTGIHNVTEAAVYGIPVIFGPNFGKFREARDLLVCGGGFSVKDASSFASLTERLTGSTDFLHEAGRQAGAYISGHAGASACIYQDLFSCKNNRECRDHLSE